MGIYDHRGATAGKDRKTAGMVEPSSTSASNGMKEYSNLEGTLGNPFSDGYWQS
jgi:hypothetical protein